jgi:hypothetical protein
MVLLPFAILAMTSLISYQRAKAELLGLSAKGGLMERAERFILLGVCFVAAAVSPAAFVPALWVFFGLLAATAAGRFVGVWKEAEGPPPASAVAPPLSMADPWGARRALYRWREGRVDSRWRAWRQARAARDGAGVRTTLHRRTSQPWGRWRARRAGVPSSRSGRIWRARREGRVGRTGRRAASRDF